MKTDPRTQNTTALEPVKKFSDKVTNFIHQMMFVSGETAEPSIETTTLIEDIVRQQVVEIVCPSAHLTVNMY
jgi:transcription initiation protein SPT3